MVVLEHSATWPGLKLEFLGGVEWGVVIFS